MQRTLDPWNLLRVMPAKGTGFAHRATDQLAATEGWPFAFLASTPLQGAPMECGCQFSLYPMTDRFVDVILPAVDRLQHPTLIVETDDLSTLVRGEAAAVFAAIRDVFITASESGIHVVSNILFSRGCPGEEECGIPPSPEDVAATKAASLPPPPQDYGDVAAQFSLYPLGREDYMEQIYAAVDQAKNSGTFGRSKNFCTRLDGTAGNVFHSIFEAFVSAPADHVVAHATISANSPSKKGA